MHILLTDVAPPGPHCQAALATLQLPRLDQLLRLLPAPLTRQGSGTSLTPLDEQIHAESLGLPVSDGLLPWAALEAQRLQLAAGADTGWGKVTPCHWHIHSDHVFMDDPTELGLSPADAEALRLAMHPYFAEDGLQLYPGTADSWLANGATLHGLPTAALARVSASPVDPWMGRQPQARALRRLQNEMQMLLYTHPINTAREARGLVPVNSFWISGTGALPAATAVANGEATQPDHRLRATARRDDAQAWLATWQTLEEGPFKALLDAAQAGQAVALTLCGTQAAKTWRGPAISGWQRLRAHWRAARASTILATL